MTVKGIVGLPVTPIAGVKHASGIDAGKLTEKLQAQFKGLNAALKEQLYRELLVNDVMDMMPGEEQDKYMHLYSAEILEVEQLAKEKLKKKSIGEIKRVVKSEKNAITVHVELKQGTGGKSLAYWEEGNFPIGFIDEYEAASNSALKLLPSQGLQSEDYTEIKTIELDVFLRKAESEELSNTVKA